MRPRRPGRFGYPPPPPRDGAVLPPPPPPPRGGPLARARRLADQVEDNQAAVAAARIIPRLRRGKKCPPMAMIPPRAGMPKKDRLAWDMATHIATMQADEDGGGDE